MNTDVTNTRLYKWLKSKNDTLATRVLYIRDELSKWLPQVVQLFPHYPSHGLDHSERIIEQLSRLLFDGNKPVVPFSTAEVYCLLCTAYLHDIGMVVSPSDTAVILASEQWSAFVSEGGKGHESYEKYLKVRESPKINDLTSFFADQSLRFLIADFVRRDHHERGKTTLEMHPFLRQLVDDGDSVAFETIADLGIGHGLPDSELGDDRRFPEERDVFDGKVNVRFLARLLRIGDLLDMSSKRADPLTARAVGPLPSDAVPHWQQYSAKKHENITPNVIEFTFECQDQDTHRVLRDWFGWLEAEVRTIGLEQLHAARHHQWKAPRCIVSSLATSDADDATQRPTIIIKPSNKATYTFHDWKLELDHDLVLQRLIYDVYDNPTVFVRELIQNALDATRCQMYADFATQNPTATPPERPTYFLKEFRERYPVIIAVTHEQVALSPDGPFESRPVFTIEDNGTGMNEEIIRRYFLQVGRSFYQSNEFRERYKFAPTSRFGLGFLSVFAVSNNITVETGRRDEETNKVTGLRLRLREPRSYLLTETWSPFEDRTDGAVTGTRIRMVLNDWPSERSLAKLVQHWCVAVEVPVIVRESGTETVIRPCPLVDGAVLAEGRSDPEAQFVLRAFNIDSDGVEGQVAVVAYKNSSGDGWCECWPRAKDLGGQQMDNLPEIDLGFTALHGITFGPAPMKVQTIGKSQWIQCCDLRSAATVSLSRTEHRPSGELSHRQDGFERNSAAGSAVARVVQAAVEKHLAESSRASGPRGSYYIGNVISVAPVEDSWRDLVPRSVMIWQSGKRMDLSVAELLSLDEVMLATWLVPNHLLGQPWPSMIRHPKEISHDAPIFSRRDAPDYCSGRLTAKLESMSLIEVEIVDDLCLMQFSSKRTNPKHYRVGPGGSAWVVDVDLHGYASLGMEPFSSILRDFVLLSERHDVVRWLCRLRDTAISDPETIRPELVESLWKTVCDGPYKFNQLLESWIEASSVPTDLKPPRNKQGNVVHFIHESLFSRRTV